MFERFFVEALDEPPDKSLPPHRHERAHLLMVFDGVVFDETPGSSEEVGPGQLLLRPAGITHANHTGEHGARLIYIDMMPSLTSVFEPLYNGRWGSVRMTFPMLRQLPEQIRCELSMADEPSKSILPALVEQMLALGARAVGSDDHPLWLRRAIDVLDHSFPKRIRLETLARAAGVSPSRLTHGFHERLGCSIGDYVRGLRVEAAARALRDGDAAIAAVAEECGFSDQAHLSRIFRELRGITPGEYRRMYRSGDCGVVTTQSQPCRDSRIVQIDPMPTSE